MSVGLTTCSSTASIAYVKGDQTTGCRRCLVRELCRAGLRSEDRFDIPGACVFQRDTERVGLCIFVLWENHVETYWTVASVILYQGQCEL